MWAGGCVGGRRRAECRLVSVLLASKIGTLCCKTDCQRGSIFTSHFGEFGCVKGWALCGPAPLPTPCPGVFFHRLPELRAKAYLSESFSCLLRARSRPFPLITRWKPKPSRHKLSFINDLKICVAFAFCRYSGTDRNWSQTCHDALDWCPRAAYRSG